MSYLVLARKYRPRSFEQLVGQEHVVQALSNALVSQRLHHAYLFTGTRGVGKTTVSRILAKSLNCTGPDGQGDITPTPCGACDACRDIDAGRHVDYIELDAASNRGVDEISQLLDQAVYKPVVGRFKVYMIDEVHMLSTTAFNAMLKTLEEPPGYLKFVLATTDPQKVPPTVLSRCLQFNLRPMAPSTVQQHLQHVLADEGIEAEPAALRLLARAARGSMRDALSLTDQAIAYGAGQLQAEAVRRMLGAVDRSQAERVLRALAAGDGAGLVATVDELRGLGLSAAGLLEELASLLQSMAVARAVPQSLPDDDPDAPAVDALAPQFAPDEMQLHYSIALHGRAELGLAPDEYSGLVMVLLRMLAFRPAGTDAADAAGGGGVAAQRPGSAVPPPASTASPARVRAALAVPPPPRVATSVPALPPPAVDAVPVASSAAADDVPPAVAGVAAASPSPATSTVPAGTPRPAPLADPAVEVGVRAPQPTVAGASSLGDHWCTTVARLTAGGAISGMARELAMQAELCAIEPGEGGSVWRLRVERESLRAPAQREKLQSALQALLNESLRLELEPGAAQDSVALREAASRARRQAEAEQTIHEDPLVRELLTQFKSARIVPGSIKPTEQRT